MSAYDVVIGIETHVELRTASKMFCGCPVDFTAEPNTAVCPVCLGLPGALPVPNARAVEWTIALGSALGCDIAAESVFHRKNYFYADLPKNYQISQFDLPLCSDGKLDVEVDGVPTVVGITRVHMEEDTGKSTHMGAGGRITGSEGSLVDFNRSGVPLVEVVSEPDIKTPEQARAYATELREIVLSLGISDARLEEGSMRFDANISLRPPGQQELGVKVEVKNMNSLRSLQRALAYEIERQTKRLDADEPIEQATRHWEEESRRTAPGRSKEESSDYRYLREPDLIPVAVSRETIEAVGSGLPELPAARRSRYREMGLDFEAARLVSAGEGLGGLLEAAVAEGAGAASVANWLTGDVMAQIRSLGTPVEETPLTGARLAELVAMVDGGELSATAAKDVLAGVMAGEGEPRQIAEERDLMQITDSGFIEEAVDRVLAEHPDEVERLRGGDGRLTGFLVGMVMKATGGKADPRQVSEMIRSRAGA
ncbi:Asp-tRNA(Asn)/Glu-tRNA(Gln) amidotransferase subunit GatB [bacterium]|nr:Asp-tRNA(Asn)/Glu-tRNA(Gln) amidotransferase subunit GatB [bacterium]